MSKEVMYHQCILEKKVADEPGSVLRQTTWLPEKFAVKGRILELKDARGNWDNGWEVVFGPNPEDKPLPEQALVRKSHDSYKIAGSVK